MLIPCGSVSDLQFLTSCEISWPSIPKLEHIFVSALSDIVTLSFDCHFCACGMGVHGYNTTIKYKTGTTICFSVMVHLYLASSGLVTLTCDLFTFYTASYICYGQLKFEVYIFSFLLDIIVHFLSDLYVTS